MEDKFTDALMNNSDCSHIKKENFSEWNWNFDNQKINDLIKHLNEAPGKHDYIRRQKCLPRIFGITIDVGYRWKLCKIGLTRTEGGSRIQSVKSEFDKIYGAKNVRKLFELKVSGIDSKSDEEIEKWVRGSCGYSINSRLATWLELIYKTDCVLTTQTFCDFIHVQIERARNPNTMLFADVQFNAETAGDLTLPPYLENRNKEKMQIELREDEIVLGRHYENDISLSEDDEDRSCRKMEESQREAEGLRIGTKDTWQKRKIHADKRAAENEDGDNYHHHKRIRILSPGDESKDYEGNIMYYAKTAVKALLKRQKKSALRSRTRSRRCPCTIL